MLFSFLIYPLNLFIFSNVFFHILSNSHFIGKHSIFYSFFINTLILQLTLESHWCKVIQKVYFLDRSLLNILFCCKKYTLMFRSTIRNCQMSKDAFIRLAVLQSKIIRGENLDKVKSDIDHIGTWNINVQKMESFFHRVRVFIEKIQHTSFVGQCLQKIVQKINQLEHYDTKLLVKLLCQNHQYFKPQYLQQFLGSFLSQVDFQVIEIDSQFLKVCIQFTKLTIMHSDFNIVLKKCCKKLKSILQNYKLDGEQNYQGNYLSLYYFLAKLYCIGAIKCINEDQKRDYQNKCSNIFIDVFQLNVKSCKKSISLLLNEVKNKKQIVEYGCKLRKLTIFTYTSQKFQNWRNNVSFPQLKFQKKHQNNIMELEKPGEIVDDNYNDQTFPQLNQQHEVQERDIPNTFVYKVDRVYDIKVQSSIAEVITPTINGSLTFEQFCVNEEIQNQFIVNQQAKQDKNMVKIYDILLQNNQTENIGQFVLKQVLQQILQQIENQIIKRHEQVILSQDKIIKGQKRKLTVQPQQEINIQQICWMQVQLIIEHLSSILLKFEEIIATNIKEAKAQQINSYKIVTQFLDKSNNQILDSLNRQRHLVQQIQQRDYLVLDVVKQQFAIYCSIVQLLSIKHSQKNLLNLDVIEEMVEQEIQQQQSIQLEEISLIIQKTLRQLFEQTLKNSICSDQNKQNRIQLTQVTQSLMIHPSYQNTSNNLFSNIGSAFLNIQINQKMKIFYEFCFQQNQGTVIARTQNKQVIFILPINKNQSFKSIKEEVNKKQNYFSLSEQINYQNLLIYNVWMKRAQSNLSIMIGPYDSAQLTIQRYQYFDKSDYFHILINVCYQPEEQKQRNFEKIKKRNQRNYILSLQKKGKRKIPSKIGEMKINKINIRNYQKVKESIDLIIGTYLNVSSTGLIVIGQPQICQQQVFQLLL